MILKAENEDGTITVYNLTTGKNGRTQRLLGPVAADYDFSECSAEIQEAVLAPWVDSEPDGTAE